MPIQTAADSISNSAGSPYGFKNRIINGGMVIDQRNAGASVNNDITGSQYCLDRWNIYGTQASKFSVQQNAGSVTPPSGFSYYAGCTSSSAYSVGSTDTFLIQQCIEGFNTADLGWGTANAQAVTLSFWVRSSLTGTFGGSLSNSAFNYSYPYSYTINSANTWEQKSITISGPTAGTWIGATNGLGIRVTWSLGSGSSASGTAGSWTASGYRSVTGAVSVVGTNGATFYITGVQLEKGSQATAFDWRDYGREFIMCQRYFQKAPFLFGAAINTTTLGVGYVYPVAMRATPTKTLLTSTPYAEVPDTTGYTASSASFNNSTSSAFSAELRIAGFSGLTSGRAPMWLAENQISFSAEL